MPPVAWVTGSFLFSVRGHSLPSEASEPSRWRGGFWWKWMVLLKQVSGSQCWHWDCCWSGCCTCRPPTLPWLLTFPLRCVLLYSSPQCITFQSSCFHLHLVQGLLHGLLLCLLKCGSVSGPTSGETLVQSELTYIITVTTVLRMIGIDYDYLPCTLAIREEIWECYVSVTV